MNWTFDFRARVQKVRACGVVHLAEGTRADLGRALAGEIAIQGDPRSVADALARGLDFHALGRRWRELARPDAHAVLAAVLTRDLAYDRELMDESKARALADEFLRQFGPNARFFTNREFRRQAADASEWVQRTAEWDPVTRATFDTGVVVVDVDRAGLLWFEDED
jgi:hypothetical protein